MIRGILTVAVVLSSLVVLVTSAQQPPSPAEPLTCGQIRSIQIDDIAKHIASHGTGCSGSNCPPRVMGCGGYAALAATVSPKPPRVEIDNGSSKPNTCWAYKSLPSGTVHLGGECIGVGANRTLPWRPLYNLANGAGVRFDNAPNLTIRRLYSEFAWDTVKPANNSNNWAVEDSWIRYGRDDSVEADHATSHNGVVRRTFMESVHTFLSVTPGDKGVLAKGVRVEFHNNLMSLGCGLPNGKACEDRDKRLKFAWSEPRGSGQAFKTRNGPKITFVFRNNVVMQGAELLGYTFNSAGKVQGGTWSPVGFNSALSLFKFFQDLNVQASGNKFYWLGAVPSNCNGGTAQGLKFTTFRGACVPVALGLKPEHWTAASNSRAAYVAEMQRWRNTVWN